MSMVLDGVNQNADVAVPTDFSGGGFPFSIALWIKPTDATPAADDHVFEFGFDAGATFSGLKVDTTGVQLLNYRVGGAFIDDLGTTSYTTGWNLVLGVYASTTDKRLYVNGDNTNEAVITDSKIAYTAEYITVGSFGPIGSEGNYFDGKIAHVCIWDGVAISEAEHTTLWNGGSGVLPNTVQSGFVSSYTKFISDASPTTGDTFSLNNSPTFDSDDPIPPAPPAGNFMPAPFSQSMVRF